MNQILNVISAITLFQLAFLIVFLLTSRRGRKISNRLLAIFLFILFLNLAEGLLKYFHFYEYYPQFAFLSDGVVFLIGPSIYLYTLSLVYSDFKWRNRYLIHGALFLIFTSTLLFYYHTQGLDKQVFIQHAITAQTLPIGFYFTALVVYLHVLIYIVVAHREVQRYRKNIRQRFSSLEKIQLKWLMILQISIVVVVMVSGVYTFLPAWGYQSLYDVGLVVGMILLLVFTNMVVWKGLRQPEIFAGVESSPKKYAGSLLNTAESDALREKLETIMVNQKCYRDADITLEQLSIIAGATPKKISQVINERFNQNFFDFINGYRIEEAKTILETSTDSKLTVLEVMFQTGFNSKSSFNTIFKKKTGYTPTAYRSRFQAHRSS